MSSAMPELNTANIEQVREACRSKLEAIGQSLNQCFDTGFGLSLGESQPHSAASALPDLAGSGVVVAFNVGQSAMLCAVSAALPLPEWHCQPDQPQISRLETLALEWSRHCLPDGMAGENPVSFSVGHLRDCIASAQPLEGAICLPLLAAREKGAPVEKIWLIWPARRIPAAEPDTAPVSLPAQNSAAGGAAFPQGLASFPPVRRRSTALDRLRPLPVPVIVKLAEKKIELGQLLAIGPGAIITFEKSCEDLLDLYVNNRLYCRGEAVKIGEKFGIKICEVGSVEQRVSAVLAE
jgi:flagellar motor switch protein FliN/FliY